MNTGTGGWKAFAVVAGVLAALKLLGVISWSWLWVLCPLWIPIALLVALMLGALVYVLALGVGKGEKE
jgi:hypothetical protein